MAKVGDAWVDGGIDAEIDQAHDDYDDSIDNYEEQVENSRTRVEYDENGRAYVTEYNPGSDSWDRVQGFDTEYDLIDELTQMQNQSFDEWSQDSGGDVTYYDEAGVEQTQDRHSFYDQGIANTANELSTLTEDYSGAARQFAAETLGFSTTDEMDAALGGLVDDVLAGQGAAEGLTADERSAYERAGASSLRGMEADLDRQLDSVAAGGSTMRTLAAADEVRSQMSDARLQNEYAMIEADFERRQINYDHKRQNYAMMVQSGMATQQEYLQGVRADKVNALQGYAQGMSNLYQERQLDLQAQELHAQTIYNSVNLSLGVSEHATQQAAERYEQSVKPYTDLMASALSELTADLNRKEVLLAEQFMNDEQGRDGGGGGPSSGDRWRGAGKVAAGLVLAPVTGGASLAFIGDGISDITGEDNVVSDSVDWVKEKANNFGKTVKSWF